MYNEFYGFSENPFELTPNPRFLYLPRSHREALASMTRGVKNLALWACYWKDTFLLKNLSELL